MTVEQIIVLGAAEALSVGTTVHMWIRSRRHLGWKAAWTPVLLVPGLGALLYVTMFAPPGEQSEDTQAQESDLDDET